MGVRSPDDWESMAEAGRYPRIYGLTSTSPGRSELRPGDHPIDERQSQLLGLGLTPSGAIVAPHDIDECGTNDEVPNDQQPGQHDGCDSERSVELRRFLKPRRQVDATDDSEDGQSHSECDTARKEIEPVPTSIRQPPADDEPHGGGCDRTQQECRQETTRDGVIQLAH